MDPNGLWASNTGIILQQVLEALAGLHAGILVSKMCYDVPLGDYRYVTIIPAGEQRWFL